MCTLISCKVGTILSTSTVCGLYWAGLWTRHQFPLALSVFLLYSRWPDWSRVQKAPNGAGLTPSVHIWNLGALQSPTLLLNVIIISFRCCKPTPQPHHPHWPSLGEQTYSYPHLICTVRCKTDFQIQGGQIKGFCKMQQMIYFKLKWIEKVRI